MVYLIILVVVVLLLKSPVVKGYFGELKINSLLSRLNPNEYTVYKDLYVPREDGTTSQIDHVIVSRYGIFVIETKNYSGWIFGSENNKNWTQTIYKKKSRFLNPIIQNKGHIKALQNYLEYYCHEDFFSIIVFTLNATLKSVDTVTPVIYSPSLLREITKHQELIIEECDMHEIKHRLSLIKKATYSEKRQHVREVDSKINNGTSPSYNTNNTKNNANKSVFQRGWFWATTFILIIFVVLSNNNDNGNSLAANNRNTALPDVQMTSTLKVNGSNLLMDVTTNIVDGAILELSIRNDNHYIKSEFVEVKDGKASLLILAEEGSPTTYIGTANFRFGLTNHPQPTAITEMYGSRGQYLVGDIVDEDDRNKSVTITTEPVYYPNKEIYDSFTLQEQIKMFDDLKYEGNGDTKVENVTLPPIWTKLTVTHNDTSNLIVYLSDESRRHLVVNQINYFTQSVLIYDGGTYTLEVEGNGEWIAEFSPVAISETGVFSGNGYMLTDGFHPSECNSWTFTHDGSSNFIVYLRMDKDKHMIMNKIGTVDDTIELNIPPETEICMWEVKADGNWTITPESP